MSLQARPGKNREIIRSLRSRTPSPSTGAGGSRRRRRRLRLYWNVPTTAPRSYTRGGAPGISPPLRRCHGTGSLRPGANRRGERRALCRSLVNMKKWFFLLSAFIFFFFAPIARSSTLVLEGRIDGSIEVTQERVFTAPKGGLNRLVFRFANPTAFKSRTVAQDISGHGVEYYPRPESVRAEKDRFGNSFTVVTWTELKGDAKAKEVYRATLGIDLKDVSSP